VRSWVRESAAACVRFAHAALRSPPTPALTNQTVLVLASVPTVLIVAIPMLDPRAVFAVDWVNHLWLIEYFGEFFNQNVTMPSVVNTAEFVGMPIALFYAHKFYAIAGALSAVVGSGLAVRMMAWTILMVQFLYICRAAIGLGADRIQAIALGIIVSWSIYPLTNLYNRGALTEFFSIALLTCSLACLLHATLGDKDKTPTRHDRHAAGLFFVAAAFTHPLVALFGGLFLGILGILVFLMGGGPGRKSLLGFGFVGACLVGAVLGPWLDLLYRFKSITETFRNNSFLPDSLDYFWSRLSPVPLDLRSLRDGIQGVSTPYLDAQVTLPLIILLGGMTVIAWRAVRAGRRNRDALAITCASVALAALAFSVSVRPSLSAWFGGIFDVFQFPYRLTSYVNLGALSATLALGPIVWGRPTRDQRWLNFCLAICVALSFAAVTLKLIHASAIRDASIPPRALPILRPLDTAFGDEDPSITWKPSPFREALHVDRLPTTFYGHGQYTITNGFGEAPAPGSVPVVYRAFTVRDGAQFGSIVPIEVTLAQTTLLVTNVQPFPWNRLTADGVLIPQRSTAVSIMMSNGRVVAFGLALLVPAGTHRIDFRFVDDGIWTRWNWISWVVLFLWFGFALCCATTVTEIARPGARI